MQGRATSHFPLCLLGFVPQPNLQAKGVNLAFEKNVVNAIYNKSLGHPYFVMFFAHDLFEHREEGIIDLKLYDSVYDKIFEHLSASRFIREFAIASDKEKETLIELADKEEVIPEVKNVRVLLKRLVSKKLVVKTGRGRYKLYHPLFKEYLERIQL